MWWARNLLERNPSEDEFLREVEAKIHTGLGPLRACLDDQTLITIEALTELIYELHLRVMRLEEARRDATGRALPLKPLPPPRRLQETDRATPANERMPKT